MTKPIKMTKAKLREVMRYLGSKKSAAKAEASRRNGRLGGRKPKLKQAATESQR